MLDGRITLRKLEIFCQVAETGSVSEVARRRDLVQPAVSEHIRTLERRVGCKLFTRRGRGLQLTDAGIRLHSWAQDILIRARELDRELHGLEDGVTGSAAVGASTTIGTYLLAAPVAEFALARPGAEISLKTSAMATAIEDVLSGALDFGVMATDGEPLPAEIVARPLPEEPYVLVAPPVGYSVPESLRPSDLQSLRFVCNLHVSPRLELIDGPLRELGLPSREVIAELNHPEAIKRAVGAGVGVAFLLRAAVERELTSGELREVEIQDLSLSAPVALVHRVDRQFSKLQDDLIRSIVQLLEHRAVARDAAANLSTPV